MQGIERELELLCGKAATGHVGVPMGVSTQDQVLAQRMPVLYTGLKTILIKTSKG